MKTKTTWNIILGILLISVITAAVLYPRFPAQMASHWNIQGEVDGTIARFWGVALFPLVILGAGLLMMLVPMIDPLKKNIEKFRSSYNLFIVVFVFYLFYIYVMTLVWNLGYRYDFSLAIVPAVAVLFYLIGILLDKSKRNWFIGIRTPWTLSSDVVWEKTHQRAAVIFKLAALLNLVGLFFPSAFFWLLIVPLVAAVVYLVIYSYILFQREAGASDIPKP